MRLAPATLLFLLTAAAFPVAAQVARESLGPRDSAAYRGTPLREAMARLNSKLLPAYAGVHPRVYFNEQELAALRQRAHGPQKQFWAQRLQALRVLTTVPPPPPAEARRAQNEVGLAIAEAAFAYRIEGDQRILDGARKFMDAAVSYDVWGYSYNKPNVDLAAGHLLYGMGAAYDLLYHDLSESDRARYRRKIVKQARLLADYYAPKPGRTYSYSQNHVFIPMAGLAVAAYALSDEVPEAPQWASLARAIYDRVLATYTPDGYYYEGFEYWIFSTPWIIPYLDAHKHATGEDLFDHPGIRAMHWYVAHSLVPGGQTVFDFGDIFEGPLTRAKGEDYPRSHPGGRFHTNYNLLFNLAARFQDAEIQGVARWMESLGHVNAEDWWTLAWRDEKLAAKPIEQLPRWRHFADHDVVYWRSDWSANATAIAFKCGPPEGHHTADLLKRFPDWHLSAGHAHPDANSFILFAKGHYLTGDSGYAGVPLAEHHNTLLVDGRGQANEGKGHDPWDGFPYDQLNKTRITRAQLDEGGFDLEGEAASSYDAKLGLTQFRRRIRLEAPERISISDEIESAQPRTFTVLLHSDTTVKRLGASEFEIPAPGAPLRIRLQSPRDAVARIEPNIVTAPGPPGSVDKGPQQQRGERLAVSTAQPAAGATFRWTLSLNAGR